MELDKTRKFWQTKDGNLRPENSGSTAKMQKTAVLRTQNRNSNNSNNKEPADGSATLESSKKPESTEEFGEIHPQVTPEGYGLRTPYGTHFNLDFLKYCQDIAEGQTYQHSPRTPRSRSSSQRSSLIASDAKSDCSESDKDVPLASPDARGETERNLWETRRRLDAFRSFRKKTPTPKEQQQYSSRLARSSPKTAMSNGQRVNFPETDPAGSPVLTNLLNAPLPQQNLQAVREQMASALARLKYLENEVKQIPVLQVKISVLQQEKQKLNADLKQCKESSQIKVPDSARKESVSSESSGSSQSLGASPSPRSSKSSHPPPPPRRKYKSVAVGPDTPHDFEPNTPKEEEPPREEALKKLTRVLGRSDVRMVSCDPSPDIVFKDACVGNRVSTSSKQTLTKQIELCNTSTMSWDLIKTENVACGDRIRTHNAETQYLELQTTDFEIQVSKSDFSSDASNQFRPASCDKAVLTQNDFIITYPKECKDACVGGSAAFQFVPMKRNVATSTPRLEVKDQAENTEKTPVLEKETTCKPDVGDFECLARILPAVTSTFTETESVPKTDSWTLTEHRKPDLMHQTTNTEILQKFEKSSFCHPETSDFSCNVLIRQGVSVSTITEKTVLKDSDTNTDIVSCQNFAAQVMPTTSDFSNIAKIFPSRKDISVSAEIEVEIAKVPANETSSQTDLETLTRWYESVVREKKVLCDAFTETNAVVQVQQPPTQNIQSEIGAYVGQVETLLEEQQSLLAGKYKELGDVLDESDIPRAESTPEKHKEAVVLPPKLMEDLNIFTNEGYTLPSELRSACETIAKTKDTEIDTLTVIEALRLLKEEWYLLSALQDSNPDYIKAFASQVRKRSPYALTKVINSLDETGNSALHYAVSHEDFGLIYTLTDIPELDVDQYNNAGYTASMLAAITRIQTEFEVKAIATLFQRANVSLHATQAGQTALMLAVSHGCVPAAKLLLKAGADINAQDEDGSTALMCATEHGHIELVKLLLALPNCDPTITDNDGSAAINIAMDSGQRDIGVLLYVHRKLDKSQEY